MFTRLSRCLFVALLFTLHAGAAETAATGSLLPDGSFESDANNDQWPDGWGRPKSGGSWQEESGNHFLRLTSGTPGEMVMLYQPVKIPVGVKAIELTFKWRVSNLKKGKQTWFDARIMMDFKDADGKKRSGYYWSARRFADAIESLSEIHLLPTFTRDVSVCHDVQASRMSLFRAFLPVREGHGVGANLICRDSTSKILHSSCPAWS